MTYLVPLAFLSLFTAVRLNAGIVHLRPFDGLVLLMIVWTFFVLRKMNLKFTVGAAMLVPFFACHALSAFSVGAENGVREALQVGLMFAFVAMLSTHLDKADVLKAGRVMVIGLGIVLIYNILWHVIVLDAWYGWKKLNNPKAVFGYLPMALGCLLLFAQPAQRRLYWLLWGGLFVVTLMSGERKALLIYGLLTAMLVARGRIAASLPVLGAGALVLVLVMNIFAGDTFVKQLNTLLNPIQSAGSLQGIYAGVSPDSLSNAQRVFAFNVASDFISENPVFGVGTNEYVTKVAERYKYLPGYLLIGIHGEFLRVLTENGIIGLAVYCAIWLVSITRLIKVLRYFYSRGEISQAQKDVAPFVLLASPFMYLALDASGTPSFAVLILVSMLPEITFYALRQRAVRQKEFAEAAESVNSLSGQNVYAAQG